MQCRRCASSMIYDFSALSTVVNSVCCISKEGICNILNGRKTISRHRFSRFTSYSFILVKRVIIIFS